MSVTLQGETPQGEIVTEIVGTQILVHGIGLHPYLRAGIRARWNKKRSQREWAEMLAKKFVVEPRVVLIDTHPTGRIYAVLSTHI